MKFTTTVWLNSSTFSPSTGLHFSTLTIPMPAGYTAAPGVNNRGDFFVQPIDGGLWLCHPNTKSGSNLLANIGMPESFNGRDIVVAVDVLVI